MRWIRCSFSIITFLTLTNVNTKSAVQQLGSAFVIYPLAIIKPLSDRWSEAPPVDSISVNQQRRSWQSGAWGSPNSWLWWGAALAACHLLKHPTAREFPLVFPWLGLLRHAPLFWHSVSVVKFPWASLQMKHCITEEVKPLKSSAFTKHLEQIQSALLYQKWIRKLTLQNLGWTIVFFEQFDAVFQKAELCCYFFATSWMKVLYLHRANVEGLPSKVVRAWSFALQNPFEGREILSSLLNSAKVFAAFYFILW